MIEDNKVSRTRANVDHTPSRTWGDVQENSITLGARITPSAFIQTAVFGQATPMAPSLSCGRFSPSNPHVMLSSSPGLGHPRGGNPFLKQSFRGPRTGAYGAPAPYHKFRAFCATHTASFGLLTAHDLGSMVSNAIISSYHELFRSSIDGIGHKAALSTTLQRGFFVCFCSNLSRLSRKSLKIPRTLWIIGCARQS
jgi:hypothetical protein